MISTAPVATNKNAENAIALRTAVTIMEGWKASAKEIEQVLRISRSTYSRVKDRTRTLTLDTDQLTRVSLILNIHATLRTVFDNPDNVYGFPRMENHNAFFEGRSPLEVMATGSIINVYETFRRIDALRSAQW